MTQPGETDEYTAFDHVLAILDHTYDSFIDYCIVNTGKISGALLEKYADDGSCPVAYDKERFGSTDITVVERDLSTVDGNGFVRHDINVLADTLLDIININRNEQGLKVSSEGVLLYNPKTRRR